MFRKARILTIVGATLMLGAAIPAASALDVNVGPSGGGGTSATATQGDTSATVTIGGGSNVGSANVGSGSTGVGAAIGNTDGPLVSAQSANGQTDAAINLGALTDLLNGVTTPPGGGGGGGGGAGAGGGGGGGVGSAFAGLAPADQQLLRNRCLSVLGSPTSFDANVVTLCRMIARL